MKIKDNTVHHRKIEAEFDQDDIRTILTKYLAKEYGFDIKPRETLIDVIFIENSTAFKVDKEFIIKVTMTNDLLKKEKGEGPPCMIG